jgi:N-acetylmuramic acid 6-phosphate etherase
VPYPSVFRCPGGADAARARATVTAARESGTDRVAVVGGLAPALSDRWRSHLPEDLTVVAAEGSALDGAVLLAARSDLPHEAHLTRTRPTVTTAGLDLLATEQVRDDLADLDTRSPEQLVDVLLAAEATVPAAVAAARVQISAAVALAEKALLVGGRMIYIGAGTPGRLAAQDAAEIPPTFGTQPGRVVAVLAGGGEATAKAVEGAEDRIDAGRDDLLALGPGPDDLVVGIAASGRTPYVLAALRAARDAGAPTVAVVNNAGSPIAATADVAVELLTGPEVLAGSTRMKAGTAQKVVLNVLSTAAMVRTGKSYGAWMVDLNASNGKLRRRAQRMLTEATGATDEEALAALESAGWKVKTALVAVLARVDSSSADNALTRTDGRARDAVALLRQLEGEQR